MSKPITDEQIRELLAYTWGHVDNMAGFAAALALADVPDLWIAQHMQREARAYCAEILNARKESNHE